MDSFYAQVESARLGLSNDVPLGVKQHEHFIAVNYAARAKGVPSRCAVERAKEICPEVVVAEVEMLQDVKPSLERYRRASETVVNILLEFFSQDLIEKASIDEAYLDLAPACAKHEIHSRDVLSQHEKVITELSDWSDEPLEERELLTKASTLMSQVRERIFQRLGFTSSCGIAHNKLLAKIAASKNKPAGQTIVFKSAASLLMRTTSLRKIRGLGGKLGKRLEKLYDSVLPKSSRPDDDPNVLGAIQSGEISFHHLEKEFGTKAARYITSRANGEDDSTITSKLKPKTLLSIKTFYHSLNFVEVQDWLRLESQELAKRAILDHQLFHRLPRTLVLQFHSSNGGHLSRRTHFLSTDFTNPEKLADDIFRTSDALRRSVDIDKVGCLGIGVGLENFHEYNDDTISPGTMPVAKITEFFQPNKPHRINQTNIEAFQAHEIPQPIQTVNEEVDFIDFNDASEEEFQSDSESLLEHGQDNGDDPLQETDDVDQIFVEDHGVMDEEDYGELFASEEPSMAMSPAKKLKLAFGRPETSREAGATAFVSRFLKASRLSFIGSWKRRFEGLLDTIPAPPALIRPKFNERVVLHVDMDAFFCSASLLKRPDLIGKPVAICWSNATAESATASSAEISSCNYVARSRGVKASMWLARAKECCPELTCLPFDFELYERIGMDFYKLLFDTTPHVEGVSCDEAYLDITHLVHEKSDVKRIAESLRAKIFHQTGGVTASCGAGRNRLIARLATAKAKPNKFYDASFLSDDDIFFELLNENVEVGSLHGIGWSTREKLQRELDVVNVKELRSIPLGRLKYVFGPKIGENMYNLCRGVDTRPWNPRPERDSVSVQISWGVRMQTLKEVHDFIGELATECYRRLGPRKGDCVNLKVWRAVENQPDHIRKGAVGHGVCDILNKSKPQVIKGKDVANQIPFGEFAKYTSSSSSASAINSVDYERLLLDAAIELYTEFRIRPEDIRGLGLSVTGLATKGANSTNSTTRKRKVASSAGGSSIVSKWVDGVGVISSRRYKTNPLSAFNNHNVTICKTDEVADTVLKSVVDSGDNACGDLIEKELLYAFEEAHCEDWPTCSSHLCSACFEKNRDAVLDCVDLVNKLIRLGANESIIVFARLHARKRWGELPESHRISHFTRCGGGLRALNECLESVNRL
jgi:nucleotidyltransferase/DNA polymerase involved in DNA repair